MIANYHNYIGYTQIENYWCFSLFSISFCDFGLFIYAIMFSKPILNMVHNSVIIAMYSFVTITIFSMNMNIKKMLFSFKFFLKLNVSYKIKIDMIHKYTP